MGSVAILDSGVLVLNRLFQAIQITSVRRAFCLLYKGDARAVQPDYTTYDWEDWVDIPVQPRDEVLATPEMRVKIPRVVLLSRFDRMPPHDVRFTRKNIYLRDRNRCQYCGEHYTTRELNLDHVVPLSRGGRSTWQNVVCCCLGCNGRKGSLLPAEAGLKLLKQPAKPSWHPLIRICFNGPAYESWRNFLDMAYWDAELKA
jgi:5-methylcytosine-specific restriction endonuclease McrA